MNPRIETLSLALASALPISFAGVAHGATLTYDADVATTGAQDGSGLGWNTTDANLWNGSGNDTWPNTTADEIIIGAGDGAAGPVTVGTVTTNRITFAPPGSGTYELAGGTITLGGTTPTIAVNADAGIASTLASSAGLTVNGSAALTLGGAQTYNGPVALANRTVTFTGNAASTATNNAFLVGGSAGRTAVHFNSTGTFNYGTTAGNARIGGNDGSGDTGAGAASHSSGNVTFARNGTYLELGTNSGASPTSYGSYELSGGTLTTTVNGGMRVGNGGLGVFTQSAGTANIGRWFAIGASTGAAAFSQGVVTLTGGNLTVNGGFRTLICDRQNSSGTLNIGTLAGGSAVMSNPNGSGVTLLGNAAGLSATVNLNSGTLVTGGALQRNGTNAASTATVNLNGGTLRPSANNVNLISGNNGLAAQVYNGGLRVDTQAFDATLSANLLATTGNGIYPAGGSLDLPVPDGSDYLGAPLVAVTTDGAGTGASAVARISGGQLVGVTLTCPGQGYAAGDTVTFTFSGGGAAVPAVPFVHVLSAGDLAANGGGGLTKLGGGKLTLTGANTFTGPLNLEGTLVSNDLSLSNTTLTIQGFTAGGLTVPLQASASFTTDGIVQVVVNGTFSPGTWPLIFYPLGGAIGGSGFAALQLQTSSLPRGVVAKLENNPTNSSVDLNITDFNPLTWKGNINGNWDINTTSNWTIGATSEKYLENDIVRFDDSVGTGSTSVVLDSVVAPASVVFSNGAKDFTLSGSGAIAGTTGLLKDNDGTLTILNANTYSGTTTVSGGTLKLGDGVTNGGLAGPLANEAAVEFHPAGSSTHAGPLSGAGDFFKTGAGTQVLTGANTANGVFQINEGILQIGDGTLNGSTGNNFYELAAGTRLRLERATAAAPAWANISGAGTLSLNTAVSGDWGNLALPAGFTGTLRVEEGRVGTNTGSGLLGAASKIEILAGAQFLGFTSATPYTTPIEIAGTGWGETGYPGGLRLAGGATATWEGSVTLTADSGIMAQRTANFTVTGPITGAHVCEFYAGDPVGDSGTLTVAPAVPGQNTYAATRINGRPNASIVAGGAQAFSSGPLEVVGAILKLNGHDLEFASLSGSGGAIGNYHPTTPATLTVGADNASTSFAGLLRDGDSAPLALVKTGTGTLALSGANSYTGNTTVSNGRLAITSPFLADSSTITLAAGAVIELNTGAADLVGTLVLGGVPVGPGTYNSSHDTYGSYFSGNGSLVVGGAFESWAASKGLDGSPGKENGPSDDPEKDGIDNQTEFYLDGDPLASDPAILPAGSLDATYLTLTFRRRDDAEASVATQAIQYGTSLASWTDVVLGAASATDLDGVIVSVVENDADPDDITVRIPRTLAPGGKLFGRLKVTR
jgi:autotransporter-associated beta strand protein